MQNSTINITSSNDALTGINSNFNGSNDTQTPSSSLCMTCKMNCDADTNCILCDYCTNWYHVVCAGVSNRKFNEFKNFPHLKYMCKLCKSKRKCDICETSITRNDPTHSIFCFSCGLLSCHECAKLSYPEIQRLNSIEKIYLCPECSLDYYCLVCNSLCNHGCIQCDSCKSWIHYKCTKMTKKQITRFKRVKDSVYYCKMCISANLPYCNLNTQKLNELNESDMVANTEHAAARVKGNTLVCEKSCNLCMECNPECTVCITACPDLQHVCETCCNCQYYDSGLFNESALNFGKWYKKFLFVVHFNMRSLSLNLSELTDFLKCLDTSPDVMLISETKLQKGADLNKVKIEGYGFYKTYSELSFGGSGIYIADGISHTKRNDLKFRIDNCETTFIELHTPGKQTNIIIAAIYRHPHDSNLNSFFAKFSSVLENIAIKYNVILMGDINIDVSPQIKENPQIQYKNMLLSLGLKNKISKPTRITETTETILDHIITNLPNEITHSGILVAGVTDHLPVYALCGLCPVRPNAQKDTYKRSITSAKKDVFLDMLGREFASLHPETNDFDPEVCLANLINAIKNTVNNVFPLIKRSKRYVKKFRKPWMTQGILNSIHTKHQLYHKYLKDKSEVNWQNYTRHNNRLTRVKEQAQDHHHSNDFQKYSGDPKMTWKKINEILNKKRDDDKLPKRLKHKDGITEDPMTIANELNKHFISKRMKLAENLPTTNRSFSETMETRMQEPIPDIVLDPSEVRKLILEMDTNKASQGIPPKIIKWSVEIITQLLTKIYNKFLAIGSYPDIFKIAKVTAIYKEGEKICGDNYRPISVLVQLNQILEKLIKSRLVDFLTQHDILMKNQYGFRKGHSTSHAITHINEKLIENLEKKYVCAVLFIDLKSAFDTIDPDILVKKLNHYGIRGNTLSLLSSYLRNRKQYVNGGDGINSFLLDVLIGVPQGSVLGPLLFIIYINDIVHCNSLSTVLFADDAAFIGYHESIKHLQRIMNTQAKNICQWLVTNRLTINVKKTKYMILHKKRGSKVHRKVKKFKLNINNFCIEQVSEFKYLGILLDNKLNWHKHIESLCSKVSKATGVLYKLRKIPENAKKMLYHTLISSKLRYGIASWGSAKSTALNRLKLLNKKAVRYVVNLSFSGNLYSAFENMKFLSVDSLYKYETAKFIHLWQNGRLPGDFNNFMERINHSHGTRANNLRHFKLSQPRTELGKTSIKFHGARLWNDLPPHIQEERVTNRFSNILKTFLLENQLTDHFFL